MEVQGVAPERVDAVEAASVVSGQVDASGNLVLTTKGGQQKNAGSVVKPLFVWPVGSIYIGTTSTDPSVLFGGGTWERFAKGRVLVGVDEGDVQFDSPMETGGAKTHTITIGEMPFHNHGGATGGALSSANSGHRATREADYATEFGTGAAGPYGGRVMIYANAGEDAHSHGISGQGGGAAHNNLQPYITVFMWRRTA